MQKATYCVMLSIWSLQNRQIHGGRKPPSSCQGLGVGGLVMNCKCSWVLGVFLGC